MSVTSTAFGNVKKETTWSIVLGILMIVAGVLAIIVPPAAGLATTLVVGWLLIFAGITHFVFGWYTRPAGSMVEEWLLGILYLVVGTYLLYRPQEGLKSLTLALGLFLFLEAIVEMVLAFRLRPLSGWGWLLANGILTLALAILIWKTWPSNSDWMIGTLVGISLIFSGVSRMVLSIEVRRALPSASS